jgi:starch synthase (maltosyl-transferring)
VSPPLPTSPPSRIRIQGLSPLVDCGRYPLKRTLGETVEVRAEILRDGHEQLRAAVRHRPPGGAGARLVEMEPTGYPDHWRAELALEALGRHELVVEAWVDRFASWREELERKVGAGQEDLSGELAEGRALLEGSLAALSGEPLRTVERTVTALADGRPQGDLVALVRDPSLSGALETSDARAELAEAPALAVDVDRERAVFGAWYELFPRSFGGFEGVRRALPRLAELGFDVVYLPPVHPIGHTHRKGRNNAAIAEPGDPGSPWAIGSEEGGHDAVHPGLGTEADFERLCAAAPELGMEIALDFAIQCSPDHPWITEHPEWFYRRPDGSLKYAENPPKRYQDIYNVDLACADWRRLWAALRDILEVWIARGVRIFRVDNPHTKPVPFWEWVIGDVRERHPEVVFLSEAFTTPARMLTLAKAGFSQSYTYFTWKNTRWELEDYLTELTSDEVSSVLRPNFFANTPDILHAYLQQGGPAAFEARLVLAATLSPSYGIYSGFEYCENVPALPWSEEYLDSEKYEVRERDLDGPLLPLAGRLNRIRRERPALRRLRPLRFLETLNEEIIAYARGSGPGMVICCVNLDPRGAREGAVDVPPDLGLPPQFTVVDLLTGERWSWEHGPNYVALDPVRRVAHVLGVAG